MAIGIGDDAAAWQASRSHRSVITTDALVDGVHFLASKMTAAQIGHRAMAANLSDVAAMGARPVLATVALGVAPATDEAWILELYRAMAGLAGGAGAIIVGGDLTRAPVATIVITIVGEVSPRRLKTRGGGRPGDVLAATGPFGGSRAGLEVLRHDPSVDPAARSAALACFAAPAPRVREGRWLAASTSVRAMMDCSDGLSTDTGRLARASGCGAVLERVPVHPAAAVVARAAGADPFDYALSGGEDFELLIAVKARAFDHLAAAFSRRFLRPLERLGHLVAEPGLWLDLEPTGKRELPASGWDHLAGGADAVSRLA